MAEQNTLLGANPPCNYWFALLLVGARAATCLTRMALALHALACFSHCPRRSAWPRADQCN
eukprot:721271-Amphidinium_carterae.1